MEFMDPIVESTPHIYFSALALMPSETGLSCQYSHLTEGGIKVVRGCAKQWSRTLWTATKHSNRINAVAILPDGTTIVSGSDNKTLQLWDAKTGVPIGQAMEGHANWVRCVAVSPDSTTIVSGSHDATLQLWDAKTGEPIGQAIEGHTDTVSSIAFSHDGMHILSVSHHAYEHFVWSCESQTQLPDMEFQQVMAISICPFQINKDGWVLGPGCKQVFWLPIGLRKELVGNKNIIAIINQEVTVFDVSAYA
ncbi:POC1 centriolar protein A [Tulasnella sp. JGI-2019a]|nr:POC1 centriolar protein A [Tulasnella sp. JGI-2019a]